MKTPSIKVEDNGPYQLEGEFKLVDEQGNEFHAKEDSVSLCRCGSSNNKPFCDGSHEEVNFKSKVRANELMVEV